MPLILERKKKQKTKKNLTSLEPQRWSNGNPVRQELRVSYCQEGEISPCGFSSLLSDLSSPASCKSLGTKNPGKIRDEPRCRSQNSDGAHGPWLLGVTHTAALGPGGFSRLKECKAVRSDPARTTTTTKTQLHSESLENFFASLFQSWCVSHVSMLILCKALKEESWSPSLHFREGSLKFSPRVVVVIFQTLRQCL